MRLNIELSGADSLDATAFGSGERVQSELELGAGSGVARDVCVRPSQWKSVVVKIASN